MMKYFWILTTASCIFTLTSGQQDPNLQPGGTKTYNFRYSTGDEGPAQIWREERREPDGTIVGRYGYVDPNGEERVVEYRANQDSGFKASGDTGPDNAALRYSQQLAAEHQREVSRALKDWTKAASRTQPASPPQQPSWSQPAARQPKTSTPRTPWSTQAVPRTSWNSPPANTWSSSPTTSAQLNDQWNSAWQNFNWNEANARVMADWDDPRSSNPLWNVGALPAQAAPPAAPASSPLPTPSWASGQPQAQRRSSPATAFRMQQQWGGQPSVDQPAVPQPPPLPSWSQGGQFTRRSGRVQHVEVSQDPFSYSYDIEHN